MDSILPRGRILDYKVFKEAIVHFIRIDDELNYDRGFQAAKVSTVTEDLRTGEHKKYYSHLILNDLQIWERFLRESVISSASENIFSGPCET